MSDIDDLIGTMDSPDIFGGFSWATLEAQAMSELESQRRFEVDEKFRQENIESLQAFQRGEVDVSKTPGYEFRRGEMEKALGRRASASRYYMSPRADKEMARGIGGLASQEYANEFLRRFKMAYTPNWARSGGSPTPPTLMSMADKYRGFGGAGPTDVGGGEAKKPWWEADPNFASIGGGYLGQNVPPYKDPELAIKGAAGDVFGRKGASKPKPFTWPKVSEEDQDRYY